MIITLSRYAFVEYPDDDTAARVLSEVESAAEGEDGMVFYNYAQLRDACVNMQQLEEGRKGERRFIGALSIFPIIYIDMKLC
jgi:hypothetical protein